MVGELPVSAPGQEHGLVAGRGRRFFRLFDLSDHLFAKSVAEWVGQILGNLKL